MELKKLMVDTKAVWVDFPGMPGFSVEVANLSRKELNGLRKRCTVQKFDRKTRAVVETLDEDKFVSEFAKATVKNWKGLTLEYLSGMLLIDVSEDDLSKELDYSEENAEVLISSSTEFDTWLNEVVFDLDYFRPGGKSGSSKTSGEDV
jgi:U3 small nucleolar ribonucleoprotein component